MHTDPISTVHTVNGYAKKIYSRLSVRSQAELIARFQKGDGGDRP